MFVTSQLPIQTTKFAIISFKRALVPPHFEKGSATHGQYCYVQVVYHKKGSICFARHKS